ncbi:MULTISPECIES: Rha family transcriptional regulator [unclassified Azospirillum]|uniref:Rha family transcriptional regulator n=1 Tax=unclassified Azospirillum TaxID=2630922 RepID=UPI000D642B9B|nr:MULTISPECIES: Rha family transcriptional regulator [unclassified Azospirillum]
MNDLICVTAVEGEPRVLDTELAAALGMERPRVIRELINRNAAELEGFGGLPCRTANPGPEGGRPGKAYYLNEEQALLVAMFSRTEKAKEVRATLVRVFAAYRRGDLVPAAPAFRVPQTFAEALRLAADNAALVALA